MLNPDGTRLAFLHRYRLPDGGEMTRLMTIGVDGTNLRCLVRGFLSHYDWMDEQRIVIWGRRSQVIADWRSRPMLANPMVAGALRLAKGVVRGLVARSVAMDMSFLAVRDRVPGDIRPIAEAVIAEDGHPMFSPRDRDWLVNDTYPSRAGIRGLMLYQVSTNRRIDLGSYPMLPAEPDASDIAHAMESVDPAVRRLFPAAQYAFTRSGLHCDLHPRWNANGTQVAFDSIHEGTRQIYVMDVSPWVSGGPAS